MLKTELSMLLEGRGIWYYTEPEDNNGNIWQISIYIGSKPIEVKITAVCPSCNRKIFFKASNEGLNFVDNGRELFQFFYDGESPQQTRRIFNNFEIVLVEGAQNKTAQEQITQGHAVRVCLSGGGRLTAVFSYGDVTVEEEDMRETIKLELLK